MIRTYPTANSSMAATAQRYVPGKPPPLPKEKAIGINPTTTDSGAAAAMTMKTMSAVPSTRSRNSDAARSVMFSPHCSTPSQPAPPLLLCPDVLLPARELAALAHRLTDAQQQTRPRPAPPVPRTTEAEQQNKGRDCDATPSWPAAPP